MRYAILVLLLASCVSLHEQPTAQNFGMIEQVASPLLNQVSSGNNGTHLSLNVILARPKRSTGKSFFRHTAKKLQRRKTKRLKLKRYLRKELRKAEKKRALLHREDSLSSKRQSREDDTLASHQATQESQNELLASVDDLPKRSATVEISIKDPGLCKVDGVAMCKHGGECMSRDEGGAPVFFCACQPAWGGDFCQERRDPCSAGLPDCGSMFRCRRDERNRLAGFTCGCQARLGWSRRSEADPRCIRITSCSQGNPCQNGGSCRQEEGGFVCVCTEHSSGDLCEHPVSADWPAPAVAAPAITRISALLESGRSADGLNGLPQRRDTGPADYGGDGGATSADAPAGGATGYHSVISANYAAPPPPPPPESSDGFSDGGSGSDDLSEGPSSAAAAVDTRGVASRYGGIISARYGGPPADGHSGYPQRRAAIAGADWPGYYNALPASGGVAPVAGYGGALWAGYDRTPQAGYDIAADRQRRSHVPVSRRTARRRRQHDKFLERLLQDVEPQIRRTARDSVIELPHR